MTLADQEGGADLAAAIDQQADRAQQRLVGGALFAAIGDEDVGGRAAGQTQRQQQTEHAARTRDR